MSDLCLGCEATETFCLEVGGCCDHCDHRPVDDRLADDVALPGLEHEDDRRAWSKLSRGYLAHLAELDYPEPWTFWGLCTPERELTDHRGDYTADETECAWLIGGGRICRALILIDAVGLGVWLTEQTPEILAELLIGMLVETEPAPGDVMLTAVQIARHMRAHQIDPAWVTGPLEHLLHALRTTTVEGDTNAQPE